MRRTQRLVSASLALMLLGSAARGQAGAPASAAAAERAAHALASTCEPSWLATFAGPHAVNGFVHALAEVDTAGGPALFAGGSFTTAGGVAASKIAKWDGKSWSALGSGMDDVVLAVTRFDGGGGPVLYAGGAFTSAGGVPARGIARWSGAAWFPVGGGVGGTVTALATFDDGGGPALYACGAFTSAGGSAANRIAKWDGASWSALGSGISGPSFPIVHALAVFDDGSGPALYAGGSFTQADGVDASNIAKWDGTSWSALGSGIVGGGVYALEVFDDGSGPALYAGGYFSNAGGVAVSDIAKWDGASWSSPGSGMSGSLLGNVAALTVFDDGSGPALYAGGTFTAAGGVPANHVAKWDGTSWSALGAGIGGTLPTVLALAAADVGGGAALYAGGNFAASPAGDEFLAKWGCPAIASLPGCSGNPAVLIPLAASAPLGVPLPLEIDALDELFGVGLLFSGSPGVDGKGCGLFVRGLGELLLALSPAPALIDSALLAGGKSDLAPFVPSSPSFAGVTIHLQAAAVGLLGSPQIELTNALAVTLGP